MATLAETIEAAESMAPADRSMAEFLAVEVQHAFDDAEGDAALAYRFLQQRVIGMLKVEVV